MLGFDPNSASRTPPPGPNPFASFPVLGDMPGKDSMGGPEAADDPMIKMLQQMMGDRVPGKGSGGMPSFPGMPPLPGQSAVVEDPYAYLWRIIHAVFALGLGIYIAFTTSFTGTRIERERPSLEYVSDPGQENGLSPSSVNFFWIFATVQVVLQTSRFFMEKGRVQHGVIMGMVIGFLPESWKGYLRLVSRYSRIWSTVSGDAFVLVFVLGVCAWLRAT